MLSITPVFILFFNDTATTEIYTLSLHDALPISLGAQVGQDFAARLADATGARVAGHTFIIGFLQSGDRKSTRLNSSHSQISYAVFCLKKKISLLSLQVYLRSDAKMTGPWPCTWI